ncbi:MAG: anhydro-N-acetylmuramic acid kinase [Chitinispirillaceae bacterium]|nr:anhydro-N-acetylmuramic acid kinase [Chitinispirillaceae bacterium]
MNKITLNQLKRLKKRKILVISSSGGLNRGGGLQYLYLLIKNDGWDILEHSYYSFSQKICEIIDQIYSAQSAAFIIEKITMLDFYLTLFITECATTLLSKLSSSLRHPHLIIFNKPFLWKGNVAENFQQSEWDLMLGDAQYLASSLRTPVITDFIRNNCIAGGSGLPPIHYGNLKIASLCGGIIAFVNIGVYSRLTIVNPAKNEIIIDTDTGPGTFLIDEIIKSHEKELLFDRDGALASKGIVDSRVMKEMAEDPWFLKPAPKIAKKEFFTHLISNQELNKLRIEDQIATITALTARTIYDLYRRETETIKENIMVVVSGRGALNQTLIENLRALFDTIQIKSIEEFGIPVDMRIPLALGLSIDAWLKGIDLPWETGNAPEIKALGRVIFP